MKKDVLKHLDRAFTEMPPELASSVEEGFRRGEIAVKQRQKIMTALSVAAILAVMCAAIALAAGAALAPRVDSVVAAPRGGGMGEEAPENTLDAPQPEAASAVRTETPQPEEVSVMPEFEAAAPITTGKQPYPENQVYYATLNGVCFHTDEHCQGMVTALPISWDAAWIKNKWPCPECVDEDRVPHLWLWCTSRGIYYHTKEDCSGMKDAQRSYPQAVTDLKEPCPVCVPDDLFTFCWATPLGQYYHAERECMGMHTARIYTQAYARLSGKLPCPVCLEGEPMEAPEPIVTPVPAAESEEFPVYYTSQGNYYHGDSQCSGMRNAKAHALPEALADGKRRCPVCQPGEPDELDLFVNTFGGGLEELYPGTRYVYTQQDTQTGVEEWMLCRTEGGIAYGTPVMLEDWKVRNEMSLPGHGGETLRRMTVLTNADNALLVAQSVPQPLAGLFAEAEEMLSEKPDLTEGEWGTPLEWLTHTMVTFDEKKEDILAVTLWFEGPETTTFRWVLNGDGAYEMALPEEEGVR